MLAGTTSVFVKQNSWTHLPLLWDQRKFPTYSKQKLCVHGPEVFSEKRTRYLPPVLVIRPEGEVYKLFNLKVLERLTARERSSSAWEISLPIALSECYRNHATGKRARSLAVTRDQPAPPAAEQSSPAAAAGRLETAAATPFASPAAATSHAGCLHSAGTSQICRTGWRHTHVILLVTLWVTG